MNNTITTARILNAMLTSQSFRAIATNLGVKSSDFMINNTFGDQLYQTIANYIIARPLEFNEEQLLSYLEANEGKTAPTEDYFITALAKLHGEDPIPVKDETSMLKDWMLRQRINGVKHKTDGLLSVADELSSYLQIQKELESTGENIGFRKSCIKDLLIRKIDVEPAIIHGLIKRSTLSCLAAPAKAYKSWHLIRLALCVSHGLDWLGHKCEKTKTLLVNTELLDGEFEERIQLVAKELGIVHIDYVHFSVIHTLGAKMGATNMFEALRKEIIDNQYKFVCFDSVYRLYGMVDGLEENSNDTMLKLAEPFEELAKTGKLAILIVTHTTKGDQTGKRAVELSSGGGWGRILRTMLGIRIVDEEQHRFVVDIVCSYYKQVHPIGIICDGPSLLVDNSYSKEELNPNCQYSNQEMLSQFTSTPESASIIYKRALGNLGIGRSAFYARLKSIPGISQPSPGLYCLADNQTK